MRCPQLTNCDNCELASQCERRKQLMMCPRVGMAEDCEACMAVEYTQYPKCKKLVYTIAQGGAQAAIKDALDMIDAPVDTPGVVTMPNALEDTLCMVIGAYSAPEFNNRYVHEFHVWVQDAPGGKVDEGLTQELMTWLGKYKAGVESQLSGARRKEDDTGARQYEAKAVVIAAARNIIHAVLCWSKGQPYDKWCKRAIESMERARALFC